jgi:hypothetical protein
MYKVIHSPCSKLVHSTYSNNGTTMKRQSYKYLTLIVHVSAYIVHLHGGSYQRKESLWLIMLGVLCSVDRASRYNSGK